MISGIDVSNHQGHINWQAVEKGGQEFAIIKATEGMEYEDRWFPHNWVEARHVGMVRGAYHFARPSEGEPEPQADYFLNIIDSVGGLKRGDLLVLDMEDQDVALNAPLLDWTLRWLRRVEAVVEFRPILYSGKWYMDPHGLTGDAEIAEFGLWLASYQDEMPAPPPSWPFIAIWQWSNRGQVAGVSGNCDLNWFNGVSKQQLMRYGKGGGVVEGG